MVGEEGGAGVGGRGEGKGGELLDGVLGFEEALVGFSGGIRVLAGGGSGEEKGR